MKADLANYDQIAESGMMEEELIVAVQEEVVDIGRKMVEKMDLGYWKQKRVQN